MHENIYYNKYKAINVMRIQEHYRKILIVNTK